VPEIFQARCDLVITINSTVGIEAIDAGIPVITLGQAFYSFPGVVAGHCEEVKVLPGLIGEALADAGNVDREIQQRFIAALKEKYQLPLNVST
jgi:capsular polysaccharide export protein